MGDCVHAEAFCAAILKQDPEHVKGACMTQIHHFQSEMKRIQ